MVIKKVVSPEPKDKKSVDAESAKISLKSPKIQSPEPQTMEELIAQTGYELKGLKRGDVIECLVTAVSAHEIRFDIGAKTEGVVIGKELEMAREVVSKLKVGDKITAFVTQVENDYNQTVLSLRRAGLDKKWKELGEKNKKNEPVSVLGIEVNRGGLLVDVGGLRGFIPASQINPSHPGGAKDLIGKALSVLVLEVDQTKNRLILSEKALTGGTISKAKSDALLKIKIGEIYEGIVSGIVPFGIFVTITFTEADSKISVDGLVHISEIAWEKVASPSDYFKSGQPVKVMVLGIEEKSGKLNLSVKQLTPNPWLALAEKYSKDQVISGKVSRVAQFGTFVELEPGVMGLIHISKIPSNTEYKPGEKMDCIIESIDTIQKRISLAPVLTEKPVGYK